VLCSRSRVAPQSWSTRVSGEGGMSTETTCYGGRRRFFLPSLPANPHAVPLCLSRAPANVPVWVDSAVTVPPVPQGIGSPGHVLARCCSLVPRSCPGAVSLAPPALLCAVLPVSELARAQSTARKQHENNRGHRWRPAWFALVHAHLDDTLRAGTAARGGSLVARGFHFGLEAHLRVCGAWGCAKPATVGQNRENMAKQLDRETEQERSSTDVLFKACHRELGLDPGRSCTNERNWDGLRSREVGGDLDWLSGSVRKLGANAPQARSE